MFEYFSNNYTWSLGVMGALNRGGQISEIDEACRPLKEYAGIKALGGDPTAQRAWFESWMKLAERVEQLGQADEEAGNTRLLHGRNIGYRRKSRRTALRQHAQLAVVHVSDDGRYAHE